MKRKQQADAQTEPFAGAGAAKPAAAQEAEDARLWQAVARTVKPLRRAAPAAAAQREQPAPKRPGQKPAAAAADKKPLPLPAAPAAAKSRKTSLSRFEDSAYRRLARGALRLEARLDLHGLTQEEAHEALLCFIRSGYARGRRHVLVITGRGRSPGSAGVLQRQVPHWLAQAPFRPYIGALNEAARGHGGAGAFYVRLRRAGKLKG